MKERDQKENNPETDLRLITCWVVLQTELGEEAEMVAEAAATEAAKNPGFFIFFLFGDGMANSSSVEKSVIGMNGRESERKSWKVLSFNFLVVEVEGRWQIINIYL